MLGGSRGAPKGRLYFLSPVCSVAYIWRREDIILRRGRFPRQVCQQSPRCLEISGVKALRKPAIDLHQELMSSGASPLTLPEVP